MEKQSPLVALIPKSTPLAHTTAPPLNITATSLD
jgi:hypothetical protein